MTTLVILNDYNGPANLITNDNYYLAEGSTHYQTSNSRNLSITGNGQNDIFVNGSMVQLGNTQTIFSSSPSVLGVSVTIGQTGSILGNSSGATIYIVGDYAKITNNGLIVGSTPISLVGDDSAVVNNGTIQFAGIYSHATFFYGERAVFKNSGLVETAHGVYAEYNIDFTNSGTFNIAGLALSFGLNAAGTSNIVNTGLISTTGPIALRGEDSIQNTINSGEIIGALDMMGGTDRLTNSGTITGEVDMGGDADLVINSGLIIGEVILGLGDDRYFAHAEGLATNGVFGQGGNDTMFGANNGDILDGGDDNDRIAGRGGEDLLFGQGGDDSLYGGNGQDTLDGGLGDDYLNGGIGSDEILGGANNDILRGGDGNDYLQGDDGNDRLFGGAGDDEIFGGTGKDVMRGNSGADVFVFTSALDSAVTEADRIRDFAVGEDLIDVSGITGFSFIGTSGFSGTGAELRYQVTSSGLRVEMDVDGDGLIDMRLNMNGVSALLESDFIL